LTATVTEDSRKFPFPNPCLAHSSDSELMQIPEEIKAIQCNSDTLLPAGIQGLSVLVCGIGSCYEGYMATHRVGRDGFLTCVDMQPENISIAETHIDAYTRTLGLDKSNCCFVHGYLEDISLQIRPHTIDLIVFNCSFDYVPNKELIFQAAQNLLRPGGELILSHFYSSRRLSSSIKEILANSLPSSDIKLLHATYEQDFRRLYEKEQFKVVRKLGIHKIQLNETTAERLSQVIEGTTQFHRAVFRCFKFSSEVEDCEEDYHQIGYYRGGIAGSESSYQLDDENLFVKDVGLVVSGNTARILLETWLNKYFEVQGDQSVHYGVWSSNTSE
jgi:arsenite methyltransferase